MQKKLYKVENDKKVFGVCGGIAEYLDADPMIVRVTWLVFSLLACGTGFIIYIICALVFPNKSEVENPNDTNCDNNTQ